MHTIPTYKMWRVNLIVYCSQKQVSSSAKLILVCGPPRLETPPLFLVDRVFYVLGQVEVLQWGYLWSRSFGSEHNRALKRNYNLQAVIQMVLTKPPSWLCPWLTGTLRVSWRSNRRLNLQVTSVSSSRLSFVKSIRWLTKSTRSFRWLQRYVGQFTWSVVFHVITIRPHQPCPKPHICIISVELWCGKYWHAHNSVSGLETWS